MKINKRTEERKEGFPIKDRNKVKREKKKFSINEKRGQKFFKPDCHSKSFFDRKRLKHPASSPKTPPSRKSYWSVIVRLIFDLIGSRVEKG